MPISPLLKKSDRLQVEKWKNSPLVRCVWDTSKRFGDVQRIVCNGVCWRVPQGGLKQLCKVWWMYWLPYLPLANPGQRYCHTCFGVIRVWWAWWWHRLLTVVCRSNMDALSTCRHVQWLLGVLGSGHHGSFLPFLGLCWAFWPGLPPILDRCRKYPNSSQMRYSAWNRTRQNLSIL